MPAASGALTPDPGALSGLLVLDFGQAAVGPVAASYLGMMGATVIKVESPAGDMVRRGQPTMRGTSVTFIGNNLTKRSVVLDLKTPGGIAQVKRLIARADVLIENFRSPEIMERLGLGYDAVLARLNPRLIYVQSSAFGPSGPWVGMYSDEWMTECVSGFAAGTGAAGGRGEFTRGAAPLDWNGAMMNTVVCLAALLQRRRTGVGTMVRTSQFGSSIFAALSRIAEFVATDRTPAPMGSAQAWRVPDQAFRTSDGWLTVSVPTERFWPRLCGALGLPALADDPRFATNAARLANRPALVAVLAAAFATDTAAGWLARLRASDVPCGPVPAGASLTVPLLADEQVVANAMLVRVDSAFGPILTQAPHWSFEKTPAALSRPSPVLGEHTAAVLAAIDDWPPWPVPAPPAEAPRGGCLDGVRVVAVAGGLPGSLAAQVLAQLGAQVLLVEPPGGGGLRRAAPQVEGEGAVYRVLCEGLRTREADLGSEAGRAAVHDDLVLADVVLVDLRVPALARLGLDADRIRALNPRALWCRIGGWGARGPRQDAAATELGVQAAAGLTRFLGRDGEEPVRMAFDVVCTATALAAAQAILAGLVWRAGSGEGQCIEVSMLASAIAINQWPTVAESGPDQVLGRPLLGPGWPRDHGFACRDGRCLIGFREEPLDRWRRFMIAIGRVDLLEDPAFTHAVATHGTLIAPRIEDTLRAWSMTALDRLVRAELGGTLVPVLDLRRLLAHEQVAHLAIVERRDRLWMRLPLATDAGLLAERRHG